MHIPAHFVNTNLDEISEFIKNNGFGILINLSNDKLWASHIPLDLEKDEKGQDVLFGHISKTNLQWKSFENNNIDVLAIFNGPHSYVSSSWYDHENVPTWNYIAIHVYGRIEILEEEELRYSLDKLVKKYEAKMVKPMDMSKVSPNALKQTNGIVGFKVIINETQAAYKLSQNRNDNDYKNIVKELSNSKDPMAISVAEEMKNKRNI